ncbi:hypothetical protein HK405_005351 [Cladochytrium tenue]|nr:hypothetical protein HK405_005351 [Cladochytrium tenue]
MTTPYSVPGCARQQRHSAATRTVDDYCLRVSAGPVPGGGRVVVNVNDEMHPILIDSEHFTGHLIVRMPNFHGIAPESDVVSVGAQEPGDSGGTGPAAVRSRGPICSPPSNYFHGRQRRYSIVVQGRRKRPFPGDDLVFGIETDSPVRTPPGTALALRIARWLDPSIQAELASQRPWINSPMLSAVNAYTVFRAADLPQVWAAARADPHLGRSEQSLEALYSRLDPSRSLACDTTDNASLRPASDDEGAPHLLPVTRPKKRIFPLSGNRVAPAGRSGFTSSTSSSDLPPLPKQPQFPKSPVTLSSTPGVVEYVPHTRETGDFDSRVDVGPFLYHSTTIPERSRLLYGENGNPPGVDSYETRKRYFADREARRTVVFDPRFVYALDFYDSYFDYSTVTIRLPGMPISALHFWDGQPLRYAARTRDRSAVFFEVVFELVEKSSVVLVG